MKAVHGNPSKKEMQIIEHVLGKNNDAVKKRKEILITEGALLALPLLVTFGMYINLILKSSSETIAGESFSPINTEPLVIFMLGFIVIYSVFLGVMYLKLKKQIEALKDEKSVKKKD